MAYTSGTFNQANGGYYFYNNVIKPFLTANAGTVWGFVEDYAPSPTGGYTYSVWKSSGGANHSGMDWYIVFQYQQPAQGAGSAIFQMYACEVYSTAGHTWNRPLLSYSSGSAITGAYSTTVFDAANQRAYTAASPNVVSTVYTVNTGAGSISQLTAGFNIPASVVIGYQVILNADGIFVDTAVGSGAINWCYFGAFSSFLPAGGPLGTDQPLGAVSSSNSFGSPSWLGTTRDPLANGAANTAPYYTTMSAGYGLPMLGSVNGQIDSYQGGPWATRWFASKPVSGSTVGGNHRGVLPAWLVTLQQTGCAFLDTVTIGADTFAYTGNALAGSPLWVDTNV